MPLNNEIRDLYKGIDQKMCRYFTCTIYIDVECNITFIFSKSNLSYFRLNFHILKKVLETRHLKEIDFKIKTRCCPTSRLNFHILKKVLETRHLEEIDVKIKTRLYMTHGDLNLKIKKGFKKNPPPPTKFFFRYAKQDIFFGLTLIWRRQVVRGDMRVIRILSHVIRTMCGFFMLKSYIFRISGKKSPL